MANNSAQQILSEEAKSKKLSLEIIRNTVEVKGQILTKPLNRKFLKSTFCKILKQA